MIANVNVFILLLDKLFFLQHYSQLWEEPYGASLTLVLKGVFCVG